RVTEQWIREAMPFGEALVLLHRVEAQPEDGGILRAEITGPVPEPAALQRSTRRVGLGKEPEHDVLAAQVAQLDCLAFVGGEGEVRRRVADVEQWHGAGVADGARSCQRE